MNLREVRTTADVAARLGVEQRDAARQLREAAREGLVLEEADRSASLADDQRQYWMLTSDGFAAWDELDAARS